MTEEEKKAIERLKLFEYKFLNLIEKQQKEIEELKVKYENTERELLNRDRKYIELLKENSELHDFIEGKE